MKIKETHHIDSSEPDSNGMFEWCHEYDLYRFEEGDTVLVARSYSKSPHEAHFLRLEQAGEAVQIDPADLKSDLAMSARDHLREQGKTEISWLGDRGYERLTDAT